MAASINYERSWIIPWALAILQSCTLGLDDTAVCQLDVFPQLLISFLERWVVAWSFKVTILVAVRLIRVQVGYSASRELNYPKMSRLQRFILARPAVIIKSLLLKKVFKKPFYCSSDYWEKLKSWKSHSSMIFVILPLEGSQYKTRNMG